jgi:maltooligosyltrehalose trehalohydrolase
MRRQLSATWTAEPARRLPIGAEPQSGGGVHFKVWAPGASELIVHVDGRDPAMLLPAGRGYHAGFVPDARTGDRYFLSVDGGRLISDPASRYQPEGPHGPSVVVDPALFEWRDDTWSGIDRSNVIVYELHVGTFTREGTWRAAAAALPAVADLGITCV